MSEDQATSKPKKKGKGLKIVLIILPLLIAGGVVGCAFMGLINIPGLTPKKKAKAIATNSAMYGEQKAPVEKKPDPKPKEAKIAPKKPVEEAPKPDMEQGAKRIAKVWNEIEVSKLKEIIAKWKDDDIARVLTKMDPGKSAEILSALDAGRASKICEAMQLQAALASK